QPAITSSAGQPFVDIYHAIWANNDGPQNPLGAVANPNTYTAQEYIGAGYVEATLKGRRTEWIAGLRYENTVQQFVSSIDPTVSFGKEGSIRYHDFLPSIHFKYSLTENEQLRAAWYRSISRPALYDVTFYSVQYEAYSEAGNPFLKRARADNMEIRYEWYPGGLDLFQTSLFYKHISDPYERTLLNANDELYPLPDQGLSYTPAGQLTAQMKNAAAANDYGWELSCTKYFGKWGFQAEYTYTWSRIIQATKFKTRSDPSNTASDIITVTKNESRPLQGQSPHLANLSLLFQDQHSGWNARVSGIYTGRRIYSVSGWYGLDYWQRGCTMLDASVEKRIGKHTRLFAKVNNLFNTFTTVDLLTNNPGFSSKLIPGQERSDRITVMKQTDKAVYYLGVQYRLP
ncbi:MAG: TonB-dependent receptor, partial [Chitinophaga rupis]